MNLETQLLPQLQAVGPKWHSTRHGEALVDSTGKIIGEVSKAIGNGYHAQAGASHIGTYINEESAKRAVEAAA